MGLEDYKKLIYEFWIEIFGRKSEEEISIYIKEKILPRLHPEFKMYAPDYREEIQPQRVPDFLNDMIKEKRAFPDSTYECLDIFGENNRICFVAYFSGTHKGEILGIQPTGKVVEGVFSQIYTIKNNKLYSARLFNDSLSLFQQIGKALLLEDNEAQIKNYFHALKKLGLIPEKSIISQ